MEDKTLLRGILYIKATEPRLHPSELLCYGWHMQCQEEHFDGDQYVLVSEYNNANTRLSLTVSLTGGLVRRTDHDNIGIIALTPGIEKFS